MMKKKINDLFKNKFQDSLIDDNPRYNSQLTDLDTVLLRKRVIFFSTYVNNQTAKDLVGKLLCLESQNPTKDITIYINSGGGSIYDGLSIIDTMERLKKNGIKIITIVCGLAASFGSVISCCGTVGHRFMTQNSVMMLHQPLISGNRGIVGQQSDIMIAAEEMKRLRNLLEKIYCKQTGLSEKIIHDLTNRDNYFDAKRAKKINIIDDIL